MITFTNYLRDVAENVNPQNTQRSLDIAKNQLMTAFEQQFKLDPNTALTWMNQLFTKILPADYKKYYDQNPLKQQNNNQTTQQNVQQKPAANNAAVR